MTQEVVECPEICAPRRKQKQQEAVRRAPSLLVPRSVRGRHEGTRRSLSKETRDDSCSDKSDEGSPEIPAEGPPAGTSLPLRLVACSSEVDGDRHAAANLLSSRRRGFMWESKGPAEQWLIVDAGHEVGVVGLQMRISGTQNDPKDVTLMRISSLGGTNADCSEDTSAHQLKAAMTAAMTLAEPAQPERIQRGTAACIHPRIFDVGGGAWVTVCRSFIQGGPEFRATQSMHAISFPIEQSRYWKVIFHNTWGPNRRVRVLAPLALLGVRPRQVEHRRSLTMLFNENVNLSEADRVIRQVARSHGISLKYAEEVWTEFQRYDADSEGSLSYTQFARVVQDLTSRSMEGFSGARAEVGEGRVRRLWQEVDADGSGRVEFKEFLLWFHNLFQNDAISSTNYSRHSPKGAVTVTERYYASMGTNRIKAALANNGKTLQPRFQR